LSTPVTNKGPAPIGPFDWEQSSPAPHLAVEGSKENNSGKKRKRHEGVTPEERAERKRRKEERKEEKKGKKEKKEKKEKSKSRLGAQENDHSE
jgi:H/ACA ribonucleoprotein complex subunit 4